MQIQTCESAGCTASRDVFSPYCSKHKVPRVAAARYGGICAYIGPRETGKTTKALQDAQESANGGPIFFISTFKNKPAYGLTFLSSDVRAVSTLLEQELTKWVKSDTLQATLILDPGPYFYKDNKLFLQTLTSELRHGLRGLRLIITAQKAVQIPPSLRKVWLAETVHGVVKRDKFPPPPPIVQTEETLAPTIATTTTTAPPSTCVTNVPPLPQMMTHQQF